MIVAKVVTTNSRIKISNSKLKIQKIVAELMQRIQVFIFQI
jgi:hypothetical protein